MICIVAIVMVVVGMACAEKRVKPPEINLFDAIGAKNVSAVKQHMDAGTKIDQWIPKGYPFEGASPLHLAVVVGNGEIVQLLIDNGADVEIKAKDQYGGTPLQWAVFFGNVEMTKLTVNVGGADVNAKDNDGCTPLCATLAPNPFISPENLDEFKKNREAIGGFLKNKGARME